MLIRLEQPNRERSDTVTVKGITDYDTYITLEETTIQTQPNEIMRSKERNNKKILPPDPPRRSERPRKQVKRFEDFQMYEIQATDDSRLKSLNTLINSGVLKIMNVDTARKIVTTPVIIC